MYKIAIKRQAPSAAYILLPVNPAELIVKVRGVNTGYDLLEVGAVVVPQGAGLRSFSISSLFPDGRESHNYVGFIENLLVRKAPARLIVTDADGGGSSRLDLNVAVVIDRFDYRERGGEPGAIFYDLDLLEYRDYSGEVIR